MRLVAYLLIVTSLIVAGITSVAAQEAIKVDQVIVGPQAGDKPTNFSIKVNFKNQTVQTINNWQFGFYMPRIFRQTSVSNRHLSMQICEKNAAHCAPLKYLKAPFTEADLSSGFTTILKPTTKFPLHPGKSYTLKLLHNSSRGSQNYSSLPQSMFLVTEDKTYNLSTTPANYQVTNYNNSAVNAKIKDHLENNWLNSSEESGLKLPVIPMPSQVILNNEGSAFSFNSSISFHDLSNNSKEQSQLWVNTLNFDLKLRVTADKENANNGITLQTVDVKELPGPEAYQLIIKSKQIIVYASNPAGFFYALQTLRQLWYQQTSLPTMTINDTPRYSYRGILLDVARHYYTVAELKNFIDLMASAKLNTLHLHLSDDEAFRIELSNYQELKVIAARRGLGQLIGPMALQQKNLSKATSNLPTATTIYSGSYNESDIADLIHYANLRQITIIPEIDIPGHSRALMKALPDTFYEKGDTSEYRGYGDDTIPVCAYNSDSEFGQKFTRTLTDILYQTATLFNKQTTLYAINNELSIGGDEVYKGTWDEAPSCQTAPWNKMSTLEKEHYFLDIFNNNAQIDKLRLSGWHEFVIDKTGHINQKHGVKANEVGHVWLWEYGPSAIKAAAHLADNNYPVVLNYPNMLYFDMTYTPSLSEPGFYWATKFGDTNAALASAKQATITETKTTLPQNIKGLEGSLWADVIPDYQQLQYMALPKLAGLAEASWSDYSQTTSHGNPNWQSLAKRLGCGKSGYLAYLHNIYGAYYRGYPNGIKLEAPLLCNNLAH